jgi:D-methionine transport system substrate-binding protein
LIDNSAIKKLLAAVLLFLSAACSRHNSNVLRIGVSPVPHGEILEQTVAPLRAQSIAIQIVNFNDYIQPNIALAAGDLDANFYQHIPYLQQFNRDHGTHFVPVTKVFIAPLALYAGRTRSLQALADHAIVTIPNDPVNAGRSLLLLQSAGLLTIKAGDTAQLTPQDINGNPRHLQIRELESAQVVRALPDTDIAAVNTNYALPAGLNPVRDSLFRENASSPYVNVLAVNAGHEKDPRILAVAAALNAPQIRTFIETKYKGSVVPAF